MRAVLRRPTAHNPLADFKARTIARAQAGRQRQHADPAGAARADGAAREAAAGAARREGEARGGRRRARARHRQGAHVRGARGRGASTRIAAAQGDDCRGGRRPQGRHRQDRRRGGVDRRLQRAGARADRLRGQGQPAVASRRRSQELDRGAATSATPTSRCSWCPTEDEVPGQAAARCASTTATSCGRARPRGAGRAGARGRLPPGARARADGAADVEGIDAAAVRDSGRARARRPWRTCARSRASSPAPRRASTTRTSIVEGMADRVRAHLREIDALASAGAADAATSVLDWTCEDEPTARELARSYGSSSSSLTSSGGLARSSSSAGSISFGDRALGARRAPRTCRARASSGSCAVSSGLIGPTLSRSTRPRA